MAVASNPSVSQSADSVRAEAHAAIAQLGRKPIVKASGRFPVAPSLFSSRRAA